MCESSEAATNSQGGQSETVQQSFIAVRQALLKANDAIARLERTMTDDMIRRVSSQMLELFNLIADSRESVSKLALPGYCQCPGDFMCSLDAFLDMIAGYMEEYGIRSIASLPGDKFSGRIHEAVLCDREFDPGSSVVKASRRKGFAWGEQVLQKERVEI